MSFFLTVRHHGGADEVRELPRGEHDVGRGPGNWLDPLDPTLSRQHARLVVTEEGVWLEALPSRNGTSVNGERVEGRVALRPGDEVLLGRTRLGLTRERPEVTRQRGQRTIDLPAGSLPIPVCESPAMQRLYGQAERLAGSTLPVVLSGESGSGKEVLARFLHATSGRAAGPFVVLNCPALPPGLVESELFGVEAGVATGVTAREGLLEKSHGGTLFLDEVADLPLEMQAKLLRFLQDRTVQRIGSRKEKVVDVRILAASNKDLLALGKEGKFRTDLYYRLAGVSLHVPPLRERREDIVPLAERVLLLSGRPVGLSDEARAALIGYAFPGNVRELEAIASRAAHLARGAEISVSDLGLPVGAAFDPGPAGTEAGEAERLLARLRAGAADFWDDVYTPFRRHELSRGVVEAMVELALAESGPSLRSLSRLLRTEVRYRKLVDFLRNNRLLPEGAPLEG